RCHFAISARTAADRPYLIFALMDIYQDATNERYWKANCKKLTTRNRVIRTVNFYGIPRL
ncbi:hypothetical protein, partial [Shigella sonnei]|uniref:hypothetical protein n=1 Tax=Shigella sonnei TaxID=624 RepID=UPI001C0A7114